MLFRPRESRKAPRNLSITAGRKTRGHWPWCGWRVLRGVGPEPARLPRQYGQHRRARTAGHGGGWARVGGVGFKHQCFNPLGFKCFTHRRSVFIGDDAREGGAGPPRIAEYVHFLWAMRETVEDDASPSPPRSRQSSARSRQKCRVGKWMTMGQPMPRAKASWARNACSCLAKDACRQSRVLGQVETVEADFAHGYGSRPGARRALKISANFFNLHVLEEVILGNVAHGCSPDRVVNAGPGVRSATGPRRAPQSSGPVPMVMTRATSAAAPRSSTPGMSPRRAKSARWQWVNISTGALVS